MLYFNVIHFGDVSTVVTYSQEKRRWFKVHTEKRKPTKMIFGGYALDNLNVSIELFLYISYCTLRKKVSTKLLLKT